MAVIALAIVAFAFYALSQASRVNSAAITAGAHVPPATRSAAPFVEAWSDRVESAPGARNGGCAWASSGAAPSLTPIRPTTSCTRSIPAAAKSGKSDSIQRMSQRPNQSLLAPVEPPSSSSPRESGCIVSIRVASSYGTLPCGITPVPCLPQSLERSSPHRRWPFSTGPARCSAKLTCRGTPDSRRTRP